VSQTNSNGCESIRASIVVTINALPAAPTIAPISYCQNAIATALTATAATGNALNWYGTNATGGTASTTAPTPSTATVGTTTYYVSQTNANGCESIRASIVVTINALPAAPTTNNIAYCQNASATALTATAATGNALNWYGTNATGGTASTTAPTPSTATVGTTTYYVSQTNSNGCESIRASIVVTINALPAAPTTAPISYCQNATAIALTATVATGNALNWYGTNATGGTASTIAPTPSTSTVGTTTYYVSQTNSNGCEGPRASIVVTINALPLFTLTNNGNVDFCIGDSVELVTAPINNYTYKWFVNNAQINNAINYNYFAKTSGIHRVEVYNVNLCMSKDSISITAHPWPVITMDHKIITSPGEQVTLTSSAINYNSLTWSPVTNLSCSNCLNPILSVVDSRYYVLTANSLGGCSVSDSVLILVQCTDDLIKVANTFTPNEDGYNDFSYPQTKGITKINVFRIVNRWGELLFENKDFEANIPIRGWDGKFKGQIVLDDVCTFYLEAQCTDGSVIVKSGNINILK
jgi:gliding motility-associated-like protein